MTDQLKNKINLIYNPQGKTGNYLICKRFDKFIYDNFFARDVWETPEGAICVSKNGYAYYVYELPTWHDLDIRLHGKTITRLILDSRFTDEEIEGHILPCLSAWTREVIIL